MPSGDHQSDQIQPEALVEAACGGDRAAFGQLFRELYPRVHRTVWAMMGDASDADEVAQQAFLKAWTHRDKFNFQSRYSTWVHRIAVNCALDALRSRKRWRDRFLTLLPGTSESNSPSPYPPHRSHSSPPSHDSPMSHSPTPATQAEHQELAGTIEAAVNKLPEDQRTVLVLREYEGYSYAEIAKALRIRPGTVMSRLSTARKKLQTLLSKELS